MHTVKFKVSGFGPVPFSEVPQLKEDVEDRLREHGHIVAGADFGEDKDSLEYQVRYGEPDLWELRCHVDECVAEIETMIGTLTVTVELVPGEEDLSKVPVITDRAQLAEWAKHRGVRPDWHEPDEQGVSAFVTQGSLDNAHFGPNSHEIGVVLYKDGRPEAFVNLAVLLALASTKEEM